MIDNDIRKEFNNRKCSGQRTLKSGFEKYSKDKSVIEYMNYLLDNNIVQDFEGMGFCFWNISDSYAMLRDSDKEYDNHIKFADHVANGESKYGFWTVCDATQRFTLTLGGHGDFWQELYKNAIEKTPVTYENYRIAYEAHRSAMSIHPALEISDDFIQYADRMFREFLDSNKEREEYGFYRLIYLSSKIKAFSKVDINVEVLCSDFFRYLSYKDTACEFAVGEWAFLNKLRSERNRAVVGITAVVNALIDIGEIQRGKKLYCEALKYGLPENAYIKKRI